MSVNSAGGSQVHADLIYNQLKKASDRFDAPVYTFAEDFAVGPGYYILSAGNKVFADNFSVIGGVSVSSKRWMLKDLARDWKVHKEVLAAGKHKVRLNSFEPFKPEDEEWLLSLLQNYHDAFRAHVLKARGHTIPRTPEAEKEALGGDVFLGRKALELGLVDKLGEMHTVLEREFPGIRVGTTSVAGKKKCKCRVGNLMFAAAQQDEEALAASLEDFGESSMTNRLEAQLPHLN